MYVLFFKVTYTAKTSIRLHPWFSWSKKERWINDRSAINYWMNHRGGSEGQLDAIKKSYPEDFTTKTY